MIHDKHTHINQSHKIDYYCSTSRRRDGLNIHINWVVLYKSACCILAPFDTSQVKQRIPCDKCTVSKYILNIYLYRGYGVLFDRSIIVIRGVSSRRKKKKKKKKDIDSTNERCVIRSDHIYRAYITFHRHSFGSHI